MQITTVVFVTFAVKSTYKNEFRKSVEFGSRKWKLR